MGPITKLIDSEVKSIDESKRIIWHKISSEIKDRMGDVVRIDGIDTKNFRKNPVVLYGHDYVGMDPLPVIGGNVGFVKEGKKFYAGTKFLNSNEVSPKLGDLVDDLWVLNKKKLMGWSIGFIPTETADIKDKEGHWIGNDFKKSELLEYSNVIIPANADAVNNAFQKGMVTRQPFLRDEMAGKFCYREINEAEVPQNKLREAIRILRFCMGMLKTKGLAEIWFKWFVECSPREASMIQDKAFYGQADLDANTILLRADVSLWDVKHTTGHEYHHLWFSHAIKNNDPGLRTVLKEHKENSEFWENAANGFAKKALRKFRESRE